MRSERSEPRTNPEKASRPSPPRAAVFVLVAVLVGGSIVAIVRDDPYSRELFPFSAYPMYSTTLSSWSARTHRAFGVLRDDPTRELPLIGDVYLFPFEHTRFYFSVNKLERGRDREPLETALRDALARYEARRRAGEHHGPAISAVRLYDLDWRLDPRAADRDTPHLRRLLLEVSSP